MSLLCACSSKGKPAGADASTGGTGGSGGASAGAAGAAGVGAGGGAGSSAGAPGSDGGPLTTADALCRAAIQARCDRLAACGAYPDSAANCAQLSAVLCPGYFFNSDSTRTIDAVSACIGDLEGESCSDIDLGLFPSCWSPGTRPEGAPCAYPSVCQSGVCTGNSSSCGVCRGGPPAATGESCASLRCRAGDFCHPATKLCTPGNTIVHAAQGQPCDSGALPAIGCAGDLHCVGPYGQTAGTCQPLPLWDLNQPCYETSTVGQCRPPLTCFATITSTTTTSQCVPPTPDPGCPTAPCDATQFCASGATIHCAPRAAVGEVCAGDGGTTIAQCVAGAFCVASTGVCTTYAKLGEACADVVQPCGDYLTCASSRCVPRGNETCPLSPADAGAH